MGAEISVDNLIIIVVTLVGFMIVMNVTGHSLSDLVDSVGPFFESLLDFVLRLLGMTVRGCEKSSEQSIQALAYAIDCTAYIHAHERCVHLDDLTPEPTLLNPDKTHDDFEIGDIHEYLGSNNVDKTLDYMPTDIKRVKFIVKDKDTTWPAWHLKEATIYNQKTDDSFQNILTMEYNDWLVPIGVYNNPSKGPRTPWIDVDYAGIPEAERTTKYKIKVETSDAGVGKYSGHDGSETDEYVYFCFSDVDESDTTYADCMNEYSKDFGDPTVVCDDTGDQYGGCSVENFEIKQRDVSRKLLGVKQPDCVVYYEAFPPGEEIYWKADEHEYDWAYIALGGAIGTVAGAGVGKSANAIVNPFGAVKNSGSALIKAGKGAPSAIKGMAKYIDNLAVMVYKAPGKFTKEAIAERRSFHSVTETFYRSGGFTPSRVDDIGIDLFENIKVRHTDDVYDYWKTLNMPVFDYDDITKQDVIEKHLVDAVDEEIALKGIVDSDEIAAIKNAFTGGDPDFYKNSAKHQIGVLSGAADASTHGYSVEKFFLKSNIFMDALERPDAFPTGKAFRDHLDHQAYVMMNELGDKEMRERMMFHSATMAKMGVNSVAFRGAVLRSMGDVEVYNQTVYDMIEKNIGLNSDYAESWAKCLNAAPGIGGKGLCLAFAVGGIEMMYRFSEMQKFDTVGINALGYYKPFDDSPKAVQLEDVANYFYVELERNIPNTRFYLASPCKGTVKVTHERCECNVADTEGSEGDYPDYFIDIHDKAADGLIFDGDKLPSDSPSGDGYFDVFPEIYKYKLSSTSNDCVLNVTHILESDTCKAAPNGQHCGAMRELANNIGSPITLEAMACCKVSTSSGYYFLPKTLCNSLSSTFYFWGTLCGETGYGDYSNCVGDYSAADNDKCGTKDEWRDVAAYDGERLMTVSVGAYVDGEYDGWLWTNYDTETFYSPFPMVFTGVENQQVPKDVYGVKGAASQDVVIDSSMPLDCGWNNLFPIRQADYNDVIYTDDDGNPRPIPVPYYQAGEADENSRSIEVNDVPKLYMGPSATGIKECLSKDAADNWFGTTGRRNNMVECLKVTVVPPEGWDAHGENYCFHEDSTKEIKLQYLNTGFWIATEWGVTAVAAAASGGPAGVGAKAAMGFIAGSSEEAVSQWLEKEYEQEWPGHPV